MRLRTLIALPIAHLLHRQNVKASAVMHPHQLVARVGPVPVNERGVVQSAKCHDVFLFTIAGALLAGNEAEAWGKVRV